MYKKLFIIIGILLILSGCEDKEIINSDIETREKIEEVVLTKRQKFILKSEDLSTNYKELTSTQQSAIKNVEELLTYLENKYQISFSYSLYYFPEILRQHERLIAIPEWGDPRFDQVEVTREIKDLKIIYNDNYSPVASQPIYLKELNRKVDEMTDLESVKIYLTYGLLKSEKEPNDFEDLLENGYLSSQNIILGESKTESM